MDTDLKWRNVWSCFYRNTSCEEAAETFFITVRTVASSRRYLLSLSKWRQGSEVSYELNDNHDNHFANHCGHAQTSLSLTIMRLDKYFHESY